ncbi:methylenetetrahydrofolate reductase-domain-containing protein [Dunaliella salina]|uniref:Methylenetetrahydrofolate reductase-domain-containing protein n=1 Tax=Dunaliella salina TaxID=3046 RepID=A0ABQ7G2A5_DUNSA|nr:methylenetetrahydrofolate reductase-domain-containing protein [Dunaliella salina]|eukprot:KAF5828731.1 methylenetetrahydrofolate reductase-domain-containing protein [Dunaliella salina]
MKVIDKINQKVAAGQHFFSFEFFPPKTEEGVDALWERMERMVAHGPIFCDITWGAGGSTANATLDLAGKMQNMVNIETMMHLTCTNMPAESLDTALTKLRESGLENILALRGDPPKGHDRFVTVEGGFSCALDLVKYIRKTHGDYFGICVAGYPEAHPETLTDDQAANEKAYTDSLSYLKAKVDAGGQLIITQLFYDCDRFLKFVKDCRAVDIQCPILPGIMPIMTYGGFKRMTGFCKVKVPQEINDTVEANKDNEEAIKAYGVDLGAKMCKYLLANGTPGLHMYSLNMEKSALAILERVGFIDNSKVPRPMPWGFVPMHSCGLRRGEAVRPVFWSNRPKSYVWRTKDSQAFPTSRWEGAMARLTFSDDPTFMQIHSYSEGRRAKAQEVWGAPTTVADVQRVFSQFYKNETGMLPWSEFSTQFGIKNGTALSSLEAAQGAVLALVDASLLPINVLLRKFAVPSETPVLGWGPPGGQVYQKGHVEFFASPEALQTLLPKLQSQPSLTYMATNASGSDINTNLQDGAVNAVSWGTFPGKEVVQATVEDLASFKVWAKEAFELWRSDWASCYESGSKSSELLESLCSSWYLVSVTDNQYTKGDFLPSVLA